MGIVELANTIMHAVSDPNFQEIASDIGDKAIEKYKVNTPLEGVEGVSLSAKVVDYIINVRQQSFFLKISRFLFQLDDISESKRLEFRKQLEENPKYRQRVGEVIILTLEKADRLEKADITGIVMKAMINRKVESSMGLRLISIVDRAFLDDLVWLHIFIERDSITNNGNILEAYVCEHLFVLGLISFGGINGGDFSGDSGGNIYNLTSAGRAMLDIVFKEKLMQVMVSDLQ